MMKVEELLRIYLIPVKAPEELDRRIERMVKEERLEQKIIGTWWSTADGCANCPDTPYVQNMVTGGGYPVNTCRYISFDMTDKLRESTANSRICVYQGDRVIPVFPTGLKGVLRNLLRHGLRTKREPLPRYECMKFNKRRDKDNRRRMRR